jgi:hypothetical protein
VALSRILSLRVVARAPISLNQVGPQSMESDAAQLAYFFSSGPKVQSIQGRKQEQIESPEALPCYITFHYLVPCLTLGICPMVFWYSFGFLCHQDVYTYVKRYVLKCQYRPGSDQHCLRRGSLSSRHTWVPSYTGSLSRFCED